MSVFLLFVEGLFSMGMDDYVKYMKWDKKVEVGNICFVFFKGMGIVVVIKDVINDILVNIF